MAATQFPQATTPSMWPQAQFHRPAIPPASYGQFQPAFAVAGANPSPQVPLPWPEFELGGVNRMPLVPAKMRSAFTMLASDPMNPAPLPLSSAILPGFAWPTAPHPSLVPLNPVQLPALPPVSPLQTLAYAPPLLFPPAFALSVRHDPPLAYQACFSPSTSNSTNVTRSSSGVAAEPAPTSTFDGSDSDSIAPPPKSAIPKTLAQLEQPREALQVKADPASASRPPAPRDERRLVSKAPNRDQYVCDGCHERGISKYEAASFVWFRHVYPHLNKDIIKELCAVCGGQFDGPIPPKRSGFSCHRCNQKFQSTDRLIAHATQHTRVKAFACADCGRTFSRQARLHSHRQRYHSREH
eukprot:m.439614 g.439614  ORF g.439614 m.439614 type:complete len:354 (+) comp56792_c0_seq3:207-1268(+)